MKLLFDKAQWSLNSDGAFLMLRVDRKDAIQFCASMKEGKKYQAELKEYRPRRSLDANAMAWKLMGELSAVLRIPPMEIYRNYIPDVGDNYDIVPIREDKIEAWDERWCRGHDGRMTVDMGECRNAKGYHNIKTYIGSSDYDTSQMSRLLDLIIDDCRENGIQVMTERERSLLIDEWGEKE